MLEQKFSGIKASQGIAIGKAFIYQQINFQIPNENISDIAAELERFTQGLKNAKTQLEHVHQKALENLGEEEAEVFEGHLEILGDEELIEEIEGKIRNSFWPAEKACFQIYEDNARELAD